MSNLFLKARWENLILVTYRVEPGFLTEYLPKGLELDTIDGSAFVSVVAFEFNDTKVKGIKFPFHVNFPEINLRFYVKSRTKRGVVFIREYVPLYFIAKFANLMFNENYVSVPLVLKPDVRMDKISSTYEITTGGKLMRLFAEARRQSYIPEAGSVEHFFKEHEWGFGKSRRGDTVMYRVQHPEWAIYPVTRFEHSMDFGLMYGRKWEILNNTEPFSVVFAKGSAVKVHSSEKLRETIR